MAVTEVKKSRVATTDIDQGDSDKVIGIVREMLDTIREGGEQAVLDYARKLDGWTGSILMTQEEIEAISRQLDDSLKEDIQFAT